MLEKIKNWYDGEYIAYKNDPGSLVFFVGGYQKRHWTSQAAHVVADFWLRYWQWTITTSLVFCGLVVAIAKHT